MDERVKRAEALVIEMCEQAAAGADLAPEIRGAAVAAAAAGLPLDRLAEITGHPEGAVQEWIVAYRARAAGRVVPD
ncbi:hypothetical protein GCM10027589_04230 [Actinocorallia lasiicapitis]